MKADFCAFNPAGVETPEEQGGLSSWILVFLLDVTAFSLLKVFRSIYPAIQRDVIIRFLLFGI
ncbi:hypothetical protein [Desulfobotulus mexicanus]|uniref:Uncharacterized protein n=1 Tax=Desulfobotulus mexicanus TaxID=2586642 RepID=A0A5S5MEQ9_9BACT|nr:hypothetical protein [Desulfobotulus mexicanus]TYT74115.1 hypothetical protein FIM25_11940 [Desulfobotulus mexicanus]